LSVKVAAIGTVSGPDTGPGASAASLVGADEARGLGQGLRVGQSVDSRDGREGRVSRLLRDRHSREVTHLVVRTRRLFGRELIVPVEWVAEVGPDRVLLKADSQGLAELPEYRTDEELDGDVRRALWRNEDLRRSGRLLLSADVREGVVTLRGFVPDRRSQRLAAEVAGRTRGVRGLRDELVPDDELEIRVARAMADDERTRAYVIQVHARQGIVRLTGALEGTVASPDTRTAAQEVAANVVGVRSAVVAFPGTLVDEPQPILPGIGLPIYATDGRLGQLEVVVMEPGSRRITDLVVAGSFPSGKADDSALGSALETRRLMIPVRSVAQVTEDAILLDVDRATSGRLPVYREQDYRAPEHDWIRTFDYRREDVRFLADPGRAAEAGAGSERQDWAGVPRG
jgi:sporulation protein YlmC with PRC-barrel domain